MKNSKIFNIVKKSGQAFVFNMSSEQWLSDGLAAYSLAGLPEFSEESLLCMMDKTSDDLFPISMNAQAVVNMEEDEYFDATIYPMTLKWKKKELIFIKYDINMGFFVNLKYISGFIDDYNYSFSVYRNQKSHYLVIKDGMFPVCIVFPDNIMNVGFLNIIAEMSGITDSRIKNSGVESAFGLCVPERNMLGGWQNMSGDIEQMEL